MRTHSLPQFLSADTADTVRTYLCATNDSMTVADGGSQVVMDLHLFLGQTASVGCILRLHRVHCNMKRI